MKKLGILKILGISYKKLKKIDDLCGMYAQLELPIDFPFTKKEQSNIKTIQKILKYGKIDNTVIYEHGLYFAMITGLIKGKTRASIVKQEKEIPIHNRKEIEITYDDLIKTVNNNPFITNEYGVKDYFYEYIESICNL